MRSFLRSTSISLIILSSVARAQESPGQITTVTVKSPNGTYYYKSKASGALEANLRFDNGNASLEYLFHYPVHRGREGAYSDLSYYLSPLIPYTYNSNTGEIKFNTTMGDEFDRDTSMLFAHLYRWSWDYHTNLKDPRTVLSTQFVGNATYIPDTDSIEMPLPVGDVTFSAVISPQDLKSDFIRYNETGSYVNPMILERVTVGVAASPIKASTISASGSIDPRQYLLSACIASMFIFML